MMHDVSLTDWIWLHLQSTSDYRQSLPSGNHADLMSEKEIFNQDSDDTSKKDGDDERHNNSYHCRRNCCKERRDTHRYWQQPLC